MFTLSIKDIIKYAQKHKTELIIKTASPQHYIPDMIKALKGVYARLLMKEYGSQLRDNLWGGHLWNPSYYIATVSENTENQIREYIQKQKQK